MTRAIDLTGLPAPDPDLEEELRPPQYQYDIGFTPPPVILQAPAFICSGFVHPPFQPLPAATGYVIDHGVVLSGSTTTEVQTTCNGLANGLVGCGILCCGNYRRIIESCANGCVIVDAPFPNPPASGTPIMILRDEHITPTLPGDLLE